jgi:hypothetical protein
MGVVSTCSQTVKSLPETMSMVYAKEKGSLLLSCLLLLMLPLSSHITLSFHSIKTWPYGAKYKGEYKQGQWYGT